MNFLSLKYSHQLLLTVCIALLSLLLYEYLWIPESTSFKILTYHFEITALQAYYVLGKLYVLLLLGLWFISESRFWRYCFIPGILLIIYQTVSILGGVHLGFIILSLLTLLFGSLYLLVYFSLSKLFFFSCTKFHRGCHH